MNNRQYRASFLLPVTALPNRKRWRLDARSVAIGFVGAAVPLLAVIYGLVRR